MLRIPGATRRYIFVGFVVITFLINVAINALLGYLAFGEQESVGTWALQNGAAADTIGTCFFLPLISCLIVTNVVRRQVRSGVVDAIEWKPTASSLSVLLRWFAKSNLIVRALVFGWVGLIVFGPLVFLGYWFIASETIESTPFICFKAISSGVYGIGVTPLIAVAALIQKPSSP